ncbi:unnamed protein product [Schistosoma curassoni]|uniref:Uncharacterized protein n=1 Tax=Schistosoma curassoni TaxID=6186 RepID=A0A183JL44_9TREM|nr:unnamed protein product [Schistosoma curassoni]
MVHSQIFDKLHRFSTLKNEHSSMCSKRDNRGFSTSIRRRSYRI